MERSGWLDSKGKTLFHVREIGSRHRAQDVSNTEIANLLVMHLGTQTAINWLRHLKSETRKHMVQRTSHTTILLLSFNHSSRQASTFGDERLSTANILTTELEYISTGTAC